MTSHDFLVIYLCGYVATILIRYIGLRIQHSDLYRYGWVKIDPWDMLLTPLIWPIVLPLTLWSYGVDIHDHFKQ